MENLVKVDNCVFTVEDYNNMKSQNIYQHFHNPTNENNRFMVQNKTGKEAFLRNLDRYEPYNTKKGIHTSLCK